CLECFVARGHHLGKTNRAPHEIEFLRAEETEIYLRWIRRQAEADFLALAKNTREPRVCILNIEYRILGRLLLGELEIEIKLAVGLAEQKKESDHVDADLIDKLVEGHVGGLARRHLNLLAAARERDELVDDRANRGDVMAERFHRGD